jgi:hypothetical protein
VRPLVVREVAFEDHVDFGDVEGAVVGEVEIEGVAVAFQLICELA